MNSPDNLFIAAALAAWFSTMEALRLVTGIRSVNRTFVDGVYLFEAGSGTVGAGFFLALGLYKPQLVLPMVGALVIAQRWRAVTVFSATGAMLAMISFAMVGLQGVWIFYQS